jgi:hypothetical protein
LGVVEKICLLKNARSNRSVGVNGLEEMDKGSL